MNVNKKRILIFGSLVAILLFIFVLMYFEPQSAFINKKVDQAQQGSAISRSTTTSKHGVEESPEIVSTSTAPLKPTKSTWVSREHKTTGEVLLTRDEAGKTYVRFENLNTSNGPDLKVYIAKSLSENGTPSNFVNLGDLTANKGNANYEVPANIDIAEYSYVVIWCKRFSVSFADAAI